MHLNYFYGEEADQFTFFRIPWVLMKAERYAGLRLEAKLLYGMMLDRMGLSRANGWLDEEGRVYIIYTNEGVMNDLPCSRQNAVLFLRQLEDAGLIKRVRRGQGLPSIIYVLKFASDEPTGQVHDDMENNKGNETETPVELSSTPETRLDTPSGAAVADDGKDRHESTRRLRFRRWTSRSSKSEFLEVPNRNPNHTDINNTDSESIYLSDSDCEEKQIGETPPVTPLERIKDQVDYATLKVDLPDDNRLDDVVYIMRDVMVANNSTTYKIHGVTMPAETVKEGFMRLSSKHIRYVLDSLNGITHSIRNIRAYMISALYTAAQTINLFTANTDNLGKQQSAITRYGYKRVNEFNNFTQRDIDFDEMERMVFGF